MKPETRIEKGISACNQRLNCFCCFVIFLIVFLAACAEPQSIAPTEPAEIVFPPTHTPQALLPTSSPSATLEPATATATIPPTPEPTLTPEIGTVNEQNQWWDGADWQALPAGEGWSVTIGEDEQVKAIDVNGAEYLYEAGSWIQASESYSHIALAPDGTALQEYLASSGARVEPAIHLGEGAYELVPAGAVLPTHIYEPETGWLAVDPDKALIDRVSTSTWFTARGSAGTIYEGLEMPFRVTTTDLSTLREVSYSAEAQEFYMVYWLRMSHLAHKFQNAGNTVDFETWLDMLRSGDPDAQIYVYSYNLNPDGSRGGLRSQWIDPRKGATIQIVYDKTFIYNPLATVTNPNDVGIKSAFILSATKAGQATIAINVDADWLDAATNENRRDRLMNATIGTPIDGMQRVALYATSHAMQQPDASMPAFTLTGKGVNASVDAAIDYLRELLGKEPEYPFWDLVEVEYN